MTGLGERTLANTARDARGFDRMMVESVLIACGFFLPFVGLVVLVYSFRGERTLTGLETIGCLLVAFPIGIIVTLLVAIAGAVADLRQVRDSDAVCPSAQTQLSTRVGGGK